MESSRNSIFDKEGLALALKHFTSSTLTMRLTGISQINIYIGLFTDFSQQSESSISVKQLEALQDELTDWILSNRIIEHLFGPNLHVEVIKQCHVILNFIVSKLTPEHIDAIWSAAQLKHCSKPVLELLTHLVKNMDFKPVLHLYSLLKGIDVKDHNVHTLNLTSSILKYLWARSLNIQDIGATLNNSPSTSSAMKSMSTPLNELTSSLKNQTFFTLLPTQSHDGESSSASADASDEDDEDEFNVMEDSSSTTPFVKPGRSVSNARPSPDSSSCWSSSDEIDPTGSTSKAVNPDGEGKISNINKRDVSSTCVEINENDSDEDSYIDGLPCSNKQPSGILLHKRPHEAISSGECCDELDDHKTSESSLNLKRLKSKNDNLMINVNVDSSSVHNDDSNSSRNSQTSQKRMSDFEGEDSCNEADMDELYCAVNAKDDSSSPGPRSSPLFSSSSSHLTTATNQPPTPPSPSFPKSRPSSKNHHDHQNQSSQSSQPQIEPHLLHHPQYSLLPQLQQQQQQQAHHHIHGHHHHNQHQSHHHSPISASSNMSRFVSVCIPENVGIARDHPLSQFSIENVCKPGQTLLWDLLQDDKINQLTEGLAQECEKVLFSLICWVNEKRIRMRFIEGCLENLEKNRSVIISLKLLPKVLMSFQNRGCSSDIHEVTLCASRDKRMLHQFFENLTLYSTRGKDTATTPEPGNNNTNSVVTGGGSGSGGSFPSKAHRQHSHYEEIHHRLSFLSFVFSATGSPDSFQLNRDQVDILWNSIASDKDSRDQLFQWIITQIRSKDQHALSPDLYQYILVEKMPLIKAENFSSTALELLHFLCVVFLNNSASTPTSQMSGDCNTTIVPSLTTTTATTTTSPSPSSSSSSLPSPITESSQSTLTQSSFSASLAPCMISEDALSDNNVVRDGVNIVEITDVTTQQTPVVSMSTNGSPSPVVVKSSSTSVQSSTPSSISLNHNLSDKSVISIAVKLLWDIALTAHSADVSMTAIRHLNHYYIHAACEDGSALSKEDEFIQGCMKSLKDSLASFKSNEELYSLKIQRTLTMIKTHLEVFRSRYCFHLRKMQLESDSSIISHRTKVCERSSQQIIRIIVQPAISSEKTHIDVYAGDYLGEFRAEVTHWWKTLAYKCHDGAISFPPDGQLRLLSQGQELLTDLDDKILSDLGFKDGQVVLLSIGRTARRPRDSSNDTFSLSPPLKKRMPAVILLNKHNFDQLFNYMQELGEMTGPSHVKAQVLSRRVWDIIQILPTSPDLLSRLQGIASTAEQENVCIQKNISSVLDDLISPEYPQKLVYCAQIIEWLRTTSNGKDSSWAQEFIECGGLQHIFDTFVSGILQSKSNTGENSWSEWKQDCLATLLQLIYKFGTNASKENSKMADFASSNLIKDSSEIAPLTKKAKRRKGSIEHKLLVHTFNQVLLDMLKDTEAVLKVLLIILNEATSPPTDINCYSNGFWGRAQIVHNTIIFLTSWTFSDPLVSKALFKCPTFIDILRKLCLEDPDPNVRRDACYGFYRLCAGYTSTQKRGHSFTPSLLNILLQFIHSAQDMTCLKLPVNNDEVAYLESESYGPGCKDYFWLVCKLLDFLEEEDKSTVDFERLCITVNDAITKREIRECRNAPTEDEGLRGLLGLMTAAFKHNPPFKFKQEGKDFLVKVFDSLFGLPNQENQNLPLCKVHSTRASAFELLVELCKESKENYETLVNLLQAQHVPTAHPSYPWDFWPHDDCRSECGYVGLINLGATCYMASCLQHLFMIPEARYAILTANIDDNVKHKPILCELQRMFAFLLESQRKSYNPRSFCKVYTMDHELLNTGEQKDMTEFFTDLISKFEEMTDDLKCMVKSLFGGTLSNNVVSLDCPHISKTSEEFYTLRCKVADMRNLWDSLDDLTVKDTLEGDNMYTCSQCGKKVRAEKRACIKKLPKILCFNTMRYTFNMITMTKEKVNTHFSFPLTLDMSPYLEENLIPGQSSSCDRDSMSNEYELIGVTVHTGTAEGGHYYSFIRERERVKDRDKWYMFNDAEVDYFDPSQIGPECFGGEMTSKTYDSVTDKFMDFSFEKTNSAYMLFYERIQEKPKESNESTAHAESAMVNGNELSSSSSSSRSSSNSKLSILPTELATWIWDDNTQFLRDKTIFERHNFEFLYQICSPLSIHNIDPSTSLLRAKLAVSFVFETFIHSKEKTNLASWLELLTRHFNSCIDACVWFLEYMSEDPHWLTKILLKCPNQIVRQLFQKLCIHVISRLRPQQKDHYMNSIDEMKKDSADIDDSIMEVHQQVDKYNCIPNFIKKLLSILNVCNAVAKPNPKHLADYFTLLFEFAKMGEEECQFLLAIEAINTVVQFYLNFCKTGSDYVEAMSDEDDEDEDELSTVYRRSTHTPHLALDEKSFKPFSLDKMVNFVAYLVESSRGSDDKLHLSENDQDSLFSSKTFPFIQRQIRDSINLRQTQNLISSFCKFNDTGSSLIVNMLLNSITRIPESSGPFFKVLSFLIDSANENSGLPNFSAVIYPRIWEVAQQTPQPTLEWLISQVIKNKIAHTMVLQGLETWVPFFLIQHTNQRVRTAAAHLLISLVPSSSFRQYYSKNPRIPVATHPSLELGTEAITIIDRIFGVLLSLLHVCKEHADSATNGTSKLVSYFAVMSYCLVSKNEKQMLVPFFSDLWNLFQPKLSEPPVPVKHNKQALLLFWYNACNDCPENVKCIVNDQDVVRDIAFNYILADHDDQEIIMFNRTMLPSYYGLLRLCCTYSRAFTRKLASHQNIQWAFKNITPYNNNYQQATIELFKLMKLFTMKYLDSNEAELDDIRAFKRQTLQMYLSSVDSRSNWTTIIAAFNILVTTQEDKEFVIANGGIPYLFQSFNTLFLMFHEATACHVTNEIVDILRFISDLLYVMKTSQSKEVKEWTLGWKDQQQDKIRKLIHLLNTYTPASVRSACYQVLYEMVQIYAKECIPAIVQNLGLGHLTFQDQYVNFSAGPYFPRRGQKVLQTKSSLRPPKTIFQMHFHPKMLDGKFGTDIEYDKAVMDYFSPYHQFVVNICRTAINNNLVNPEVVGFCSMVALESLPMNSTIFTAFWNELLDEAEDESGAYLETNDSSKLCKVASAQFIDLLCNNCTHFEGYILNILSQEHSFLALEVPFTFFSRLAYKVKKTSLPLQMSTVSSRLSSELLDYDASPGPKDFSSLLTILRAFYIALSYESEYKLSEETLKFLTESRKQFVTLIQSTCDSSVSPAASSSSSSSHASSTLSTQSSATEAIVEKIESVISSILLKFSQNNN